MPNKFTTLLKNINQETTDLADDSISCTTQKFVDKIDHANIAKCHAFRLRRISG